MCNCGCNTCETKGPLLTEGKVKSLLSEGLQYHIDKKIPLFETVYPMGSDKHLALIKEARKMYSRNVIDLCEDDEALIKTHLGEFGIYETVNFEGEEYDIISKDGDWVYLRSIHDTQVGRKEIKVKEKDITINESESVPLDLPMLNEASYTRKGGNGPHYKWKVTLTNGKNKTVDAESKSKVKDFLTTSELIIGIKSIEKVGDEIVKPALRENLEEAEFKGKEVPLNKPKRGGSKAYYVYVRDPKTKKIKKVSFGSGGLRAKIKNKEKRNAFAARHNCKNKKDRTTAGYWSCNLPKYAKVLGLGANMNTFW